MQSYIIIHILATLFIKKYATSHNLSFFLLFNTRIPIFAEENQRIQNYGTRNLLGKKRRPDRRAEDRQTLGRRSQQRRQALPRPASERTRRGRETSIKQEGNLFGLPSLRRERDSFRLRLSEAKNPRGGEKPRHSKKATFSGCLLCGERGIRTPGASQHAGFQDRCNRPLYHLSELSFERLLV